MISAASVRHENPEPLSFRNTPRWSEHSAFQENKVYNIPLFLRSTLILPGQTFIISHVSMEAAMFFSENDEVFGLVCPHPKGDIYELGVICRIAPNEEYTDDVRITATGENRFRVLGPPRTLLEYYNVCRQDVLILPEQLPPEKLQYSSKTVRLTNRIETRWPPFVYKSFNVNDLINAIKQRLNSVRELQLDPVSMSFAIGQHMQLSPTAKFELFEHNSVVARLRMELELLESSPQITCKTCSKVLAFSRDLFDMSLKRNLLFCSPAWMADDVTVMAVSGVAVPSQPCYQVCRYRDYGWSAAFCVSCRTHVGWSFMAATVGITPKQFWAFFREPCVSNSAKLMFRVMNAERER